MDKWGIVFAGGGGKGAYEIGAWKAINEFGLNIQAVSGASVGALNGVLFACGSLALSENIWKEQISRKTILTRKSEEEITYIIEKELKNAESKKKKITPILRNFLFQGVTATILTRVICKYFREGYFSRIELEKLILENEVYKNIRNTNISCYAACFNMSKLKEEYFRLNDCDEKSIIEVLLASSAIPIIYPSETIKGKDEYVDGGIPFIGDNTPIMPLCEIEGCNKILVINLEPRKILSSTILSVVTLKSYLEVPALAARASVTGIIIPPIAIPSITRIVIKRAIKEMKKMQNYKDVKIYRHYPSKSLGGMLNGTLNLEQEAIEERINLGYKDTKRYLEKNLSEICN